MYFPERNRDAWKNYIAAIFSEISFLSKRIFYFAAMSFIEETLFNEI